MNRIAIAFSSAWLSYIDNLPSAPISRVPGDRYLFHALMARIYIGCQSGRGTTASKLALDATSLGVSPRTGVRMARMMVEDGWLTEEVEGRAKVLRATERLIKYWEGHAVTFTGELIRHGLLDAVTK